MNHYKPRLKLEKREAGWYITNWPEDGFEDCGPYATKLEAEEDRAGLTRTLENWDKRRFFTTEKPEPRASKRTKARA